MENSTFNFSDYLVRNGYERTPTYNLKTLSFATFQKQLVDGDWNSLTIFYDRGMQVFHAAHPQKGIVYNEQPTPTDEAAAAAILKDIELIINI